MAVQKQLVETTASTLQKSGNRWRVVLAKGDQQGSSGYYSESVLREYGPAALPPKSKAFINHDEKRDPRDMFGFYPDGAWYEEGVGLVSELEVFPHYKNLIETIAEHTGLSIYMMGDIDEDGNVTKLIPHRTNSVDLVSFPGLEGSGIVEKLYESARNAAIVESSLGLPQGNQPGATAAPGDKERNPMDEKVLEALNALKADLAPVIAFVNEQKAAAEAAVAEAKAQADAAAQEKEAAIESYSAAVKAVSDAELLPSQEKRILEAAKRGEDVAPLIEEAKAVVAEAKAAGVTAPGYVIEKAAGETDADFSFNFGGRR